MKKLIIVAIIVTILGGAYYAVSPLFMTKVVNDELPEERIPTELERMSETQGGFENLNKDRQELMLQQMDELEEVGAIGNQDVMLSLGGGNAPTKIMNTIGHPAEGMVRIIDADDGKILRFEDFKTINGPRLHVYLAKDLEANEFIDLGPIRGTEGNINYNIPDGVDLADYKYAMHWCVPFGVLFNFAEINEK